MDLVKVQSQLELSLAQLSPSLLVFFVGLDGVGLVGVGVSLVGFIVCVGVGVGGVGDVSVVGV